MICGLSVMWNASYIRRGNLWAWIDLHGQAVSSSFLSAVDRRQVREESTWFSLQVTIHRGGRSRAWIWSRNHGRVLPSSQASLCTLFSYTVESCLPGGVLQPTVDLALSIGQQSRQSHTDKRVNQSHLGNPLTETPQVTLECDKLTVNERQLGQTWSQEWHFGLLYRPWNNVYRKKSS